MTKKQRRLNNDPLYNTSEAGEYVYENSRTLANKRCRGEGPDYVKLGHLIRYRQSDLDSYIESRVVKLEGGREATT